MGSFRTGGWWIRTPNCKAGLSGIGPTRRSDFRLPTASPGCRCPTTFPADDTFFSYGGDWGEYATSGAFEINGVVLPDRTPQPELADLAAVYAPVELLDTSADGRRVQLRNEYLFTDLSELEATWWFEADGMVIDEGTWDVALAPGEESWFELPSEVSLERGPAVVTFNLTFSLSEDTAWAEAGHVVSRLQSQLTSPAPAVPATSAETLSLRIDPKRITVSGPDVEVELDAVTGAIQRYEVAGHRILMDGPTPHFWRPPTQNDEMNGLVGTTQWLRASQGLIAAESEGSGVAVSSVTATQPDPGVVTIVVEGQVAEADRADYSMTYQISASGTLAVSTRLAASQESGELPAVGTNLTVPGDLTRVEWLGNGPHETWRDRHAGATFGRWNAEIDDLFFPQVVPQATGNRTEVREYALTRADGTGLLVSAVNTPLEVTALGYSDEAIEAADHPYEMTSDGLVHLTVGAQHGLGTTWSSVVPPEFQLPADQAHEVSYLLTPLTDPTVQAAP